MQCAEDLQRAWSELCALLERSSAAEIASGACTLCIVHWRKVCCLLRLEIRWCWGQASENRDANIFSAWDAQNGGWRNYIPITTLDLWKYISRGFTDVFFGFRVGLLQVVFRHISGDVHEHPDINLEVIWICWDLGDVLESGLTMLPSFQHRL